MANVNSAQTGAQSDLSQRRAGQTTTALPRQPDTIAAHVPPRPTTAPTPSLLYWRMQKGLIQVQLAQHSHVDRATIQRLEAGGEARLSTISKLAKALGITPAQLQARPPES